MLLVTDRRIYAPGETVYFKAFLVDSINNYLQSGVEKLYVDWVDAKDKIISRLILSNSNFKTSGRFILPDSLNEGFYWIRAYSKKILSTNINNIAVMPFYVTVNKQPLKETSEKVLVNNSYDKPVLQFYPEGGSIISGLNSTIAVSAKDTRGNPLIVSGIIKDNYERVAATFTTNKYGLGRFLYYPK